VFVLEFIGTGRKLAVEAMREEGRHVFCVFAEERQTANVCVVLAIDEEAGNKAARLSQKVQEIGTAWRSVSAKESCDRRRELIGEDEGCCNAGYFALAGMGIRWNAGAHRELNAHGGGRRRIGFELCDFAELQDGKNYECVQQANRAEYYERRRRYVVHSVLLNLERERNGAGCRASPVPPRPQTLWKEKTCERIRR
jgi:hypothetical protein